MADYLEILQMVCEDSKEQLSLLHKYFEQENWKDFTILAHACKGFCLNIGAQSCGEAAKELEMAGKNEDAASIRSNLEPFEEQFGKLLQAIQEVVQKYLA